MQIKTTVTYHFKPTSMARIKRQIIPSVGENMEKWEPSYIAAGEVKLCSHFGKQLGGCSVKHRVTI